MNRCSDIRGSISKRFKQYKHSFNTFVFKVFNRCSKYVVAVNVCMCGEGGPP